MGIYAPIALLSNWTPEYSTKYPPTPPADDFGTYQVMERQWRTSEHYEQLQELLLATIEVPFVLSKVIALGLGSLTSLSRVDEHCVHQHALVTALHSTLVQRGILSSSGSSSERYVQDPAYTQRDRDILHSAGLTVLQDPQAFLDLDESSVLVNIGPDFPVEEIVADICRPGIIIWNRDRHPNSAVR